MRTWFKKAKAATFAGALVLGLLVALGAHFTSGSPHAQAFAATAATAYTQETITLEHDQTEFVIPVTIEHPDAFAGVELALQAAEGIEVTSVTYSTAQSKAGPTVARGLVWFSTFSGGNNFSGSLTASVHARYKGDENTQIVLDHAAFYTKEGAAFSTQNVPLRTVVTISREGASNTPAPLDPPATDPDTAAGSGNPGSGALVGDGDTTGTSSTAGTISTASAASTAAIGSATDTTGATGTASTGLLDTPTGTPTVEVSPTDVPATSLTANPIAGDGAPLVNTLILGFAIACLLIAVVLGCLLIKKRSEKEATKEVL